MGVSVGFFATVPNEAWSLFAFGAAGALFYKLRPHVRHWFYQNRLDRRLARDGSILREEATELQRAMGDDPGHLEVSQVIGLAMFEGLIAAIPPWFFHLRYDTLGPRIFGAVVGILLLVALWRRLNDPEPKPLFPSAHVPREAVIGFGASMAIVAMLLLLMFEFF
jgi:hypothetical protein